MTKFVLDSGALIALERNTDRMRVVAHRLSQGIGRAYVPASVVAQVWRNSPRQHAARRLLKSRVVDIRDLTAARAIDIGALLARTGGCDVVDAHVALLARVTGATVLTSDPDDIRALDATVPIVTV